MLLDIDVGILLGGAGVFVLRVIPLWLAEDEISLDAPAPCTTNVGDSALDTRTPLPTTNAGSDCGRGRTFTTAAAFYHLFILLITIIPDITERNIL